jgi:hypothetical protein
MCQDPTTTYICGHTIRGPRITCGRPWAPLLHIIRATSATLPTPCPPCSKSAPTLVYPSVPPPPYSSTVVSLAPPPVAAPQIQYQYRPTPTYPYPTYASTPIYQYQYQYPPQVRYQTPYIFQQPPYIPMPGQGSFGTPFPVPDNVPREVRWERRSNSTYHQVVHYHFNSVPNAIPVGARGYNTFHGFDTGSLPPGWGPAGAPPPLPVIGSTPGNIIPPNMILGIPAPVPPAVTAPVPPNPNPNPQVTPAGSGTPAPAPPTPNETVAATPAHDTSAESSTTSLTETSSGTSGSSTSTSTSGTSTPTSDSRPATPNTGRVRPAVNARVHFSPDTRGGST